MGSEGGVDSTLWSDNVIAQAETYRVYCEPQEMCMAVNKEASHPGLGQRVAATMPAFQTKGL